MGLLQRSIDLVRRGSILLFLVAANSATGPGIPAKSLRPLGQIGRASWYGPGFHGRKTASGKIFDRTKLSCAHRTLPLGTKVRVDALDTGQSAILEVTDRGPYVGGRILDLSEAAAVLLGLREQGVGRVRVTPVGKVG